ncbi:MAG: hypothetical protein N2510_04490 [Ignavibacteria bacterium]|nr:hypothetical protein [Ignavibacteria bacterium]
MKKFHLAIPVTVLILTFGVLYLNPGMLSANDKDGKTCKSKTSCSEKSKTDKCGSEVKAGGEWSNFEFTTDQACCEKMKAELEKELMALAGIKEVKIGEACSVSGMAKVTVSYDSNETNEDNIASFVKTKNYDCSDKKGCSKEGSEKKDCKTRKNNDSKDL